MKFSEKETNLLLELLKDEDSRLDRLSLKEYEEYNLSERHRITNQLIHKLSS
jgi:hypothetical protein